MPWHRADILISLFLVVASAGLYSRALPNEFVYDDVEYVVNNPGVHSGLSARGLAWAFTTRHEGNWHPVTWLSLQLDYQLHGLQPRGYHLTNVFLHAANAVLLFLVLRAMTGDLWPSAAVAGFFALHPLHVESVAWVAERKDVLSTLFLLLTLAAYRAYVRRPALWRYLLLLLPFALGLMAKPMLVTLPCLLLLLDYWPLNRMQKAEGRRQNEDKGKLNEAANGICSSFIIHHSSFYLLLEKLPLFALSAASAILTVLAQEEGGALKSIEWLPYSVRLNNALVSYVAYLGKTLWPAGLAVFYPHPREHLPAWQVAAAGAVLAGISALVLWQWRRRPYLAVGWFWYLGTLVPVIGLVQVGEQAMADRYTYVPLIGIFMMMAWGVRDLARAWGQVPMAAAAAALLLLACTICTWNQIGYWRDPQTLWERAVRVTTANYVAHHNLGALFLRQEKLDDARAHYLAAVTINPRDGDAHNYLGVILGREGRLPKAAEHFAEAVRWSPRMAEAHFNLGAALEATGQSAAALPEFQEAVQIAPGNAVYMNRLGEALARAGKSTAALDCFRRAAILEPRMADYRRNLAQALFDDGRLPEANEEYQEASRLDPSWPERVNQEAWKLATSAQAQLRDGRQALRLANQVCQATAFQDAEFLDTLAAAQTEVGQFDQAVASARKALKLAEAVNQWRRAEEIAKRIKLYEKGQPYRGER